VVTIRRKSLNLLLVLFLFGTGSSINASIGFGAFIENWYSNVFKANVISITGEANEYLKERISEIEIELEKINVSNQAIINVSRKDQTVNSQAGIENYLRSHLKEIENTRNTLIDDSFKPEVNEIKVNQLTQTEEDFNEIVNEVLEN
jgi:hypothetical protein